MTRPPILPGMRSIALYGDAWRGIADERVNPGLWHLDILGARIDYSDPATCGALMAWCHRELERVIAETPKPRRPYLNAARVALNEARPWDGDSVRRAVEAVCEVLP